MDSGCVSEGEGEEAFGIHNQRPGDADAAGPGPHSEPQGCRVLPPHLHLFFPPSQ